MLWCGHTMVWLICLECHGSALTQKMDYQVFCRRLEQDLWLLIWLQICPK